MTLDHPGFCHDFGSFNFDFFFRKTSGFQSSEIIFVELPRSRGGQELARDPTGKALCADGSHGAVWFERWTVEQSHSIFLGISRWILFVWVHVAEYILWSYGWIDISTRVMHVYIYIHIQNYIYIYIIKWSYTVGVCVYIYIYNIHTYTLYTCIIPDCIIVLFIYHTWQKFAKPPSLIPILFPGKCHPVWG